MDTIILQFKEIKGNSLIDGYKEGIQLMSFSHGVVLPMSFDTANTERTMGRPSFSEFNLSKLTDQSTPALYAACAAGTKLGDATISIGRNEGGKFMLQMKYVMSNAMIASISTSGGGSDMMDSLSINFSALTSQYTQQNPDSTLAGTAPFGWDLSTNKAATPAA
ncbi:type VI secretion system tube protein Hcp [Paraburkholderia sp.]|uniref:Hcp family type VI secretion system effector n=1 Tax=Paraburkholderia sp. TaxID=1926495 RepID=UPI0023836A45|nr:type VI secretion system tube protein Hcp [Paraburkholderia sp.]MDE1180906.1 type VI secretion system tube protein Hcp [Paraburkholderia sp.]